MNSEMMVLKVNLPLSNRSFFFKVQDPSQSVDTIIKNGIIELRSRGLLQEAQQLEYLWASHQLVTKIEKKK